MAVKRQSMAGRVRGIRQHDPQAGGGGGGGMVFDLSSVENTEFWEPKLRGNEIDILPFTVTRRDILDKNDVRPGDLHWRMPYRIHRNIGAENKIVTCPTTFGKKCPICEEQARMAKEYGYKDDRVKALRYSERTLFAVRDLNNPDKGVQLWPISYHLFTKMLMEELAAADPEGSLDCFADPDGGFSLSLRFSEEKMGDNSFLECSRIDFNDRDDLEDAILEAVPALDKVVLDIPFDKLERLFLDLPDPEGKEQQEPNPAPERGSRTSAPAGRTSARRQPEPAPDQQDEQQDQDDAPPPARRSAPPARTTPPAARTAPPARQAPPARGAAPARGGAPTRRQPDPAPDQQDEIICPAAEGGGGFGLTTDQFDECDSCADWEACRKKADAAKKSR